MKKAISLMLAGSLALSMVACGGSASSSAPASSEAASGSTSSGAPVAGVCWYNFADTFIANARQCLENTAAADGTIQITAADSQGTIETQTSNINNFYTQGVDYLVVNNINTSAISQMCKQANDENTTLIFANTDSPSDEDFATYDNIYFVSSRAEQSGQNMGEALLEYWNEHPEADRNGNGKLDYIMLLGMQGNYDTLMRSTKSVEVLTNAGVEVNCIGGEQLCEWSRATAQEKVAALLANYSDDIDAVISCNDDMALGAIEALKAGGFFTGDADKYIPVCGVDATAVGVQAIEDGTMLVTSLNSPVALGKGLYKTMYLLSKGEELTTENLNIPGAEVDGHRVWLSYTKITKDNVADATYDVTDPSL